MPIFGAFRYLGLKVDEMFLFFNITLGYMCCFMSFFSAHTHTVCRYWILKCVRFEKKTKKRIKNSKDLDGPLLLQRWKSEPLHMVSNSW